jgi:hypothetical protein
MKCSYKNCVEEGFVSLRVNKMLRPFCIKHFSILNEKRTKSKEKKEKAGATNDS